MFCYYIHEIENATLEQSHLLTQIQTAPTSHTSTQSSSSPYPAPPSSAYHFPPQQHPPVPVAPSPIARPHQPHARHALVRHLRRHSIEVMLPRNLCCRFLRSRRSCRVGGRRGRLGIHRSFGCRLRLWAGRRGGRGGCRGCWLSGFGLLMGLMRVCGERALRGLHCVFERTLHA